MKRLILFLSIVTVVTACTKSEILESSLKSTISHVKPKVLNNPIKANINIHTGFINDWPLSIAFENEKTNKVDSVVISDTTTQVLQLSIEDTYTIRVRRLSEINGGISCYFALSGSDSDQPIEQASASDTLIIMTKQTLLTDYTITNGCRS
jgi:hypothetical protein